MSKKFGKFLLFSAIAGVAAYGAYQYLQTKDQNASPVDTDDADDDFDDFNEDLDEEPAAEKERSYVSLNLDKAAAIASESFHKAKEVIVDSVQQVRDTVKSVAEGQGSFETNFTDLTALKRESEELKDEAVKTATDAAKAVTEDFFTSDASEEETSQTQENAAPEAAPEATVNSSSAESEVISNATVPEETFFENTEPVQAESPASSEMVEEFFDDDKDSL